MKNLSPKNSDNIFRKSGILIFIITIFLTAFSLICPQGTQGGEIYTYTDKNSVTFITNTPIPEKYQGKAQKIDEYNPLTPSEKKELEREAKNKRQKQELEEAEKIRI